jgi:uncharacterized RDD family membrane protein YckC
MTSDNTITTEQAGLFRRIGAILYDSLLIMALSMVYGGSILVIKYKIFGVSLEAGERASVGLIGFLGLVILIIAFFCFFWMRAGQTTGMRAWRLQLVNAEGKPPSLQQCLLRCALAPLSMAPVGLGYLWCLVDSESMCLHDRISRSHIVLLPKEK